MNGKTNVDRLADAGIIDPKTLDKEGYDAINNMDLTQDEIDKLKGFQKKLKLDRLPLQGPDKRGGGGWQL
jgi:hypothetical protein